MITPYLKSEKQVNQSYGAACIEKLLTRKRLDGQGPVMTEQNSNMQLIQNLLQNLCELLTQQKDLYAIRALLRVIQLSKNQLVPFAPTLGQVLRNFIAEVAQDEKSSSPNFVYILFEACALTLTYVKDNREAF